MTQQQTTHSGKTDAGSVSAPDFGAGRRAFLATLGATTVGATILGLPGAANAQSVTNTDILNFALNLEYLEAEFYLTAIGSSLSDADVDGNTTLGPLGPVSRGHRVPFADPVVSKFAAELANHERTHVRYLRGLLGPSRVARPAIDVNQAFTTAAVAAGLISAGQTFDAYANDANFLLASFIFEDVGVTAYKGAAPLLTGAAAISAAAGILATEAYHAGAIRVLCYERGLITQTNRISDLRDRVSGVVEDDVGIGDQNSTIIVPVDVNATVFGRAPGQVLNIVYGAPGNPTSGLFFPSGTNGTFKTAG